MSEESGEEIEEGAGETRGAQADESEDYAELDRVRLSKMVPVEFLHPGKFQPRRHFNKDDIRELAHSIKERGVLQPILVRRHDEIANAYEIIAGERRWRASQEASLHEVPVIIKELDDAAALEIALIENLQRRDLTAVEEAEGFDRLMKEFSYTQEALAEHLGKSRSHVTNTLRLLSLPDVVKTMLDNEQLSAGHARALLSLKDPVAVARKIVADGLSVRQVEALAKDSKGGKKGKARGKKAPGETTKDANTRALERELGTLLGMNVSIVYHEGDGGTLSVHYKTLDQLESVIARLSHNPPSIGGVDGPDSSQDPGAMSMGVGRVEDMEAGDREEAASES